MACIDRERSLDGRVLVEIRGYLAMSIYDVYRRHAQEAQRQAAATSGDYKACWLQIAEGWLSLVPNRCQRAENATQDKQQPESELLH